MLTPSSVNSKADPRLWYSFNPASFELPGPASWGVGNRQNTLTYGPGVVTMDLSVTKEFKIRASKSLQFQFQAFNAFNHFNPGDPNTSLNLAFSESCMTGGGCTNSNANFGTITGPAVQARHAEASLRFVF